MRILFWFALLLFSANLSIDHNDKSKAAMPAESINIPLAQVLPPAPPNREIYFLDASPHRIMEHAKLSSVPMIVLYYRPNNKPCQQQESIVQDVCRGWLNHLRFYKVDVTKWPGAVAYDVPALIFVQPDSTGYPVLLNHSSGLMSRSQTFDFMKAAMKLVKTVTFTSSQNKLPEISGSEIGNTVRGSNCPAVVLFLEEGSFAGLVSEQILLEGAKKYNQQAMFFRCTGTALEGLLPGVWPSTYSFVLHPDQKITVEQIYGLLNKSRMEKLLKKLPPASPNKP